ncbi:MAG: DNA polymerase III subunit alpha [Neisseriaceae bacterium]|nr:MAG: DNA polymerase III subunit alpha [Neisseriaceae bacterium]
MQDFIHLRLHTEYSISNSTLRVKDAIKVAKDNNMLGLALTDMQNMFGLVKFYKGCRSNGIKPIIGCELAIEGNGFFYNVIALAKNLQGYRQICEWITRSYTENKHSDTPYAKEAWLFEKTNDDVIALSGGIFGDIAHYIERNEVENAIQQAQKWQQSFGENYFIELQRIEIKDCRNLIEESLKIASQLNISVVATHPVQFAKADDYIAHEVRVCIANGEIYDDASRKINYGADQYFKSTDEMLELFSDIPSAIHNSVEIAKKCNLEITLGKYFLPDYATPNNQNLEEYLSVLSHQGLDARLKELFVTDELIAENEHTYRARLELEIETIIQMGFPGYFLIVADFIGWAKQNNIPVGPGRGSGAGSLVAFSLGITDIDPLRYSLLFERFLNPERVSMPDFDIDFCQDKRELVIRYVQDKYGSNAVSQIATFGTMSSKAVIKDVGRALGLSYGLCDSISKLILNTPAKSWGLDEAYEQFADLKQKIDNGFESGDEDIERLWTMSKQLEDLTRSVGKHAAGVLIAPSKLSDFCPLYLADGMQTSQLDKDDVESIGLVKFDFLGLRNLTIIQEALENIKKLHDVDLHLSNSDFEDKDVYKLLQAGNTTAIFQLESQGMKRLLVKLEPSRFEDIIAVLALYRPGPLGSGMVDDFVKRKKGEQEIDYFHNDLREVLDPTYGVIVYQEQVMQISQTIGGYTLGGADLLRRAMGKKKKEEMDKHRALFTDGALKKGYEQSLAEKLFDLMAMFAEYGFNKSHTAAYAVVSYHTAYLKAHYKACFMAATLSSELDNTDKLYEFYQDCISNDLTVIPPDINLSDYRFKAIDKDTICYALGALKGMGQNVSEDIVNERTQNGVFTSLLDFCRRVDKKAVNKRTLESLVKAGCFDKLEANRAKLLFNLPKIIDFVENERNNANQGSLFDDMFADGDESFSADVELDDYPNFTIKEQLVNEKQAIGFYLTASLFDEYSAVISKLDVYPLSKINLEDEDVKEILDAKYAKYKPKILVCGIINYMGSRPTKKGGKISFIKIEDASGELEFVVFNELLEKSKHLLTMDNLVFVRGEVIYDSFRDQVKINASEILTLDEVLTQQVESVKLELNSKISFTDISTLFTQSDIGARIKGSYSNETARCNFVIPEQYKFKLNLDNLGKLTESLGKSGWVFELNKV